MFAAAPKSLRTSGRDPSPGKRKTTGLRRLWASLTAVRRIGLWLTAAVLLTGGMRVVANHFLPGSKSAEESGDKSGAAASSSDEVLKYGAWWLPSSVSFDALDFTSVTSTSDVSGNSSPSPMIAAIPHVEDSNSALALGGGVEIGSNPWTEPKQLALLNINSSASLAAAFAAASSISMAPTAFSSSNLLEDLSEAPVSIPSTGPAATALTTVPEASPGMLLVVSMAGLAFSRRRR